MSETVFLPGGRDARGTLDVAADAAASDGAHPARCVVACPPHPQHGGTRSDGRLTAVSDELNGRDVDCLRFDYGPWDGGRGERTDATNAVAWARERYDRVSLFGFSFGAAVALSAAARGADVDAVAALAPPARLGSARADVETDPGIGGVDVVADLSEIPAEVRVGVFYGARDDVAAVGPVVELARERGFDVTEFAADHFFVGRERTVARAIAAFLLERD
ncbi:alpha/beta hydrolase [Halobellus rubicundus]|uniref:Alpha/beta hydrolase n=1 Tax=Halobellus rubicundus TaxID=2996466 RepID=A0ABD5MCY2_9EURY